jgi:hypothetical protein
MKMPHQFIPQHPETEPLNETQCSPAIMEEYIKNDSDRANGQSTYQPVYDCVDSSPFYDNSECYIDEKDVIELPPPSQNNEGQINEPY